MTTMANSPTAPAAGVWVQAADLRLTSSGGGAKFVRHDGAARRVEGWRRPSPRWYRNLVANPDVELTVGGTIRPMRA